MVVVVRGAVLFGLWLGEKVNRVSTWMADRRRDADAKDLIGYFLLFAAVAVVGTAFLFAFLEATYGGVVAL